MVADRGTTTPPAVRERRKWMKLCRSNFAPADPGVGYTPELELLNERLNLIADDMEAVRPQRTARAECAIWSAMLRDVMAFPHLEDGVETTINILYGIAASMERLVEPEPANPPATAFLQRLIRNRTMFGAVGPWRHYGWQSGQPKRRRRHG